MRRVAAILLLVLGMVPAAEALTIRDLIELSRAGLGDEVLLALIEVNRGVYAIDSATLISLKAAGVSDRVIAALVRSGREQPPPPPMWETPEPVDEAWSQPTPHVVVIEHHTAPEIVQVPVAVPVYVAAPARRHRTVPASVESTYVPFQPGPPPARPETTRSGGQSGYWGFGGKLRSDAWRQPSPKAEPPKRDSTPRDSDRRREGAERAADAKRTDEPRKAEQEARSRHDRASPKD